MPKNLYSADLSRQMALPGPMLQAQTAASSWNAARLLKFVGSGLAVLGSG